MEAIIVITCAVYLYWQGVKGEYDDDDTCGIHQENEQKDNKNDSFF